MNETDPFYEEVKGKVLGGQKRLPYREYLPRLTIHYITNVATIEELETFEKVLNEKLATYDYSATSRTHSNGS